MAMPLMIPQLKKADYAAAQKVDVFIANSSEVQNRIKKYYRRSSTVVHPPVDVSRFNPARERDNYYVALGRQVPYKRVDLAVAAATKFNLPLKVYGNGSEHERLVEWLGQPLSFSPNGLATHQMRRSIEALNHAKGYIFPAEEDFGIVQVEALAAGAPVIAYGKGGALDIVQDGESGVLFDTQTVDAVVEAIQKAESQSFLPATLRRKAKRFEKSLFITKMRKLVADATRP